MFKTQNTFLNELHTTVTVLFNDTSLRNYAACWVLGGGLLLGIGLQWNWIQQNCPDTGWWNTVHPVCAQNWLRMALGVPITLVIVIISYLGLGTLYATGHSEGRRQGLRLIAAAYGIWFALLPLFWSGWEEQWMFALAAGFGISLLYVFRRMIIKAWQRLTGFIQKHPPSAYLLLCVLTIMLAGLAEVVIRLQFPMERSYGAAPSFFAMTIWNGLLLAAISNIIYALTNRIYFSLMFVGGAYILFTCVHMMKLTHLNMPFYPWELVMATDILRFLPAFVGWAFFMAGLATAAVYLGITFAMLRDTTGKQTFLWRTCTGLLGLSLLASVWYHRQLPGGQEVMRMLNITRLDFQHKASYINNGFLLATMLQADLWEALSVPPGYSREAIYDIRKRYTESQRASVLTDTAAPVSVIFYQVESLWDPVAAGFDFTQDPLPHYRSLLNSFPSGDIYVPSYGGLSARTDFEALSGLSHALLPPGGTAYELYLNRPLPDALPALFRKHGYRTTAISAFYRTFFNREQAMEMLGFEHFWGLEDDKPWLPREGAHISDEAVVDMVIKETRKGRPFFIYAETNASHGPYHHIKRFDDSALQLRHGADGPLNRKVKNHANLMWKADSALARLLDYLRQQPYKVLIAIYSDHQPGFARHVWKRDNMSETERLQQRYRVPLLLWANYELPADTLQTSTNLLGCKVLKHTSVAPGWFQHFLCELAEAYPVVSRVVTDQNGLPQPLHSVKWQKTPLLQQYRMLQYDLLLGKQYAVPEHQKQP